MVKIHKLEKNQEKPQRRYPAGWGENKIFEPSTFWVQDRTATSSTV